MHNRDGRTSKRRRHRLRSHQATTAALYTAANPTRLTAQPVIQDIRYQSRNAFICVQCCRQQAAQAHTATAISRARAKNSSDKQHDFHHITHTNIHKPHTFSRPATPLTRTFARNRYQHAFTEPPHRTYDVTPRLLFATHITAFTLITGRGQHDRSVISRNSAHLLAYARAFRQARLAT